MTKLHIFVLCLGVGCLATPLQATPPGYWILSTPPAPPQSQSGHHPRYGYYPGYANRVHTSTYSYGWFGVKPRRHWSKHHGYYRQYTEWSAR